MPTNADFNKISITAKLTAYMRQFSDIPFASEIAEAINAHAAFIEILDNYNLTTADFNWYALLFEARYKSIANQIKELKSQQVLELASGFSLRGLAMSINSPLVYIESDLGDLENEKQAILTNICKRCQLSMPVNFGLANINALDYVQIQTGISKLDKNSELTIVSEGLLQYLSAKELAQVVQNIALVLRQFGGQWITPDFTIQSSVTSATPQQQHFRKIISSLTQRQMYNNSFANQAQLEKFLADYGLKVERLDQLDLVAELTSLHKLQLIEAELDKLRPQMVLWQVSLMG